MVIASTLLEFFEEFRSNQAAEKLKQLVATTTTVLRDGKEVAIPIKDITLGDIVILSAGSMIPADLRILESKDIYVGQSSLTGESDAVRKLSHTELTEDELDSISDLDTICFMGTNVMSGTGKGIVLKIADNTYFGKVAHTIQIGKPKTSFENGIDSVSKLLIRFMLIFIGVAFFINSIKHDTLVAFTFAVAIAIAITPLLLPVILSSSLAKGAVNMAKKETIVKKLNSIQSFGAMNILCTDKTGTLTQNKMTVEKIFYNGKLLDAEEVKQNIDTNLEKLVYISMLCNDTKISANNELTGDPTETALVDMGFNLQFEKNIYDKNPRIKEIPFDSDRKLMTTVNKINNKYVVLTKGGVDELLAKCNKYLYDGEERNDLENYKKVITKNNEDMAKDALRVLSMAYKEIDHEPTDEEMKNIEQDLIYVGMVGMIDPPRLEVKDAVDKCEKAGIKTVMITGDHKITAIAIAKSLGILQSEEEALTGAELEKMSDEDLTKNIRKYSVYARVSPEHKVRIVKAWQANGEIVAMTGDGVNDAPALKTADIGCAMGIVGTDVSKEAADVILTDDNFATIVSSVEEGRRIYDNILKAIQFLLSSNVGEVITLFVAILITPLLGNLFGIDINLIVPLLPIHILWINLVTDSLPALALAVDPPQKDVMDRKPNKNKSVFTKGMIWRIVYQGILIGVITIVAFIVGLATPDENLPVIEELTNEEIKVEIGQTMAFCVLAFSQLVHVFNVRDNKTSIFKTGIFSNKQLILAVLASAALMLGILLIPALRHVFSIPVLPVGNILEIVVLSLMPLIVVELFKLIKINTSKSEKL